VGTPLSAITPPARDAAVLKAADSTSAELGRGRRLTLAKFHKNTLHGRERSDVSE